MSAQNFRCRIFSVAVLPSRDFTLTSSTGKPICTVQVLMTSCTGSPEAAPSDCHNDYL